MKRVLWFLGLCLLLPSLAAAQAVVSNENFTWVWEDVVWDDADTVGCLGEALILNGPIHVVLHETTDPRGGWRGKWHYQPQNLEVVGATSGDHYNSLGVTQGTWAAGGVNYPLYVETVINTAPIVKPGTGFMLNARWMFRVTINANGETTVALDLLDVKCNAH